MISKETSTDIALAHRELESARGLLAAVDQELARPYTGDLRDDFGRPVQGLQLGVPCGGTGHRLFNVSWKVAKPVIEMYIAECQSRIEILSEKALVEAGNREG